MKYSFFIPNPILEERINRLVNLGIKQKGYITEDQLASEFKKVGDYNSQLEILHERLKENNVVVRKHHLTQEEFNHAICKKYFISDAEVDLTNVKQEDECLTFDEFAALFVAKFDEKVKDEKKIAIKQRLASRINHVESCPECMNWCKYGTKLYQNICNGLVPFPNMKFFDIFDREYEERQRICKSRKERCENEGHMFGDWERRIDPKTNYVEWSRTCKRCFFVEKTDTKPLELREKKLTK